MPDRLERLQAILGAAYRLERELGHGGMATVYVAHDVRHDRPVALKLLRPELAASLGPERFYVDSYLSLAYYYGGDTARAFELLGPSGRSGQGRGSDRPGHWQRVPGSPRGVWRGRGVRSTA